MREPDWLPEWIPNIVLLEREWEGFGWINISRFDIKLRMWDVQAWNVVDPTSRYSFINSVVPAGHSIHQIITAMGGRDAKMLRHTASPGWALDGIDVTNLGRMRIPSNPIFSRPLPLP